MGLDNVPRCRHVKVNGTQCGSPALRRRRYCFFHNRMLDGKRRFSENQVKPRQMFSMCLLEDANSVQVALMQVLQLLGSGQMDYKMAALMLYGLQTASVNLRHAQFEAKKPTDVVIDRDDVHRTCIGGPQWFERDFDEQVEEEEVESEDQDEVEDEEDAEGIAASPQAEATPAPRTKPEVKHISPEEARMQVRGLVRNWLLETVAESAAARSG